MQPREITLVDLRRILHEGAGADEAVDLEGEVLDVQWGDLGYDSLALLETVARLQREFGIVLDDDATSSATTPRALLALANQA